ANEVRKIEAQPSCWSFQARMRTEVTKDRDFDRGKLHARFRCRGETRFNHHVRDRCSHYPRWRRLNDHASLYVGRSGRVLDTLTLLSFDALSRLGRRVYYR